MEGFDLGAGARRRWRCALVSAALACLLSVVVPALAKPAAAPRLQEYALDVWTSRNGLPHNTLRDIAQTPEGYLWLATWEGVARYNGLDFTVFGRASSPSLPDNGIGALYVDADGTLWLGDSRGNVTSRDLKGVWKRWELPSGRAPAIMIESLRKDSRGRLWLLYESVGLGRLDPDGSFHHFPPPAGMASINNHTHMAIDDQDRVWLGTYHGLLYLDQRGQIQPAPSHFDLPAGLAWPYRAADGSMWVSAQDGVYQMKGDRLVLQHRLPGVGALTEMLRDSHGNFWLGTENSGLWRADANGVEQLQRADGLVDQRVVSLHEDREGSIWVGMNGGLMRLRETLFTSYTDADGLSGDFVRTLLEDHHRNLWVGTSRGLDRMDAAGRITPFLLGGGGREPSVLSLAQGRAGDMWVGTRGDGVFHVDAAGKVKHYPQGSALPRGNYRAVLVDGRDRVWLGSAQGVLQLVDGKAIPLPFADAPETVTLALAWINDAVWVGSAHGAWYVDDAGLHRLPIERFGARAVYGFRQLGDAIWVTTDRGLLRWRDGAFTAVGLEQGLPVDTVFEFLPDARGNVWVSSNRGVWRARLDTLEAVADGKVPQLAGHMYREIDGLVSSQANGSSGPAGVVRADGSVWVATAGGVVKVVPDTLQRFQAQVPPPPVIESVKLEGEAYPWREPAAAHVPGGRRLSISYVGLSYLVSDRIRYRTRLEGLDADWVERGTQRAVEYVGLPPGDYVLHVSAAHQEGAWSDSAALWKFTVAPLWWQRLEVRVALALLFALGLFGVYRYRIHRYRAHNQRLTQLVDERTQDLKLQAENLLRANEEKTELAIRLRLQAEEFERQAHEDPLTALPNRRAFDETLARDFARSRRSGHALSLVVLDLDHFKLINDTWSHNVGDQVLREVAHLLKSSCRDADLPARLGGEEFALVLYGTSAADAHVICDRLRALFHARDNWAGIDGLKVTFSAGLVERRSDDTSPHALYCRADAALYQAKNTGRDRICVDDLLPA